MDNEKFIAAARRGLSTRSSVGDREGQGRGLVDGHEVKYQWSSGSTKIRETVWVDGVEVLNTAPHGHYVRI